jgi:hypothetical protein
MLSCVRGYPPGARDAWLCPRPQEPRSQQPLPRSAPPRSASAVGLVNQPSGGRPRSVQAGPASSGLDARPAAGTWRTNGPRTRSTRNTWPAGTPTRTQISGDSGHGCARAGRRRAEHAEVPASSHAAGRARTCDRRIKSPLLYQLSYGGERGNVPVLTVAGRYAPAKATVSISTSIRGSIKPLTSTMVIRGRWSAKISPWARPTSSAREMSVT